MAAPFAVVTTESYEGRRKPVSRELGASAFAFTQFDSQPHHAGLEHDEVESGQEEVYVTLSGEGVLRVGDDEVELRPGVYVLVQPAHRRQVVAGPSGLSYLVVGAC